MGHCQMGMSDRLLRTSEFKGQFKEFKGQTISKIPLQSTLRKGWYWGSQSFKESLSGRLDQLKAEGLPVAKDCRRRVQAKDHAERDAERIISEAVLHFKTEEGGREDFAGLPRGSPGRVAVAWRTSQKLSWIADRLSIQSADNVSVPVRKFALKSESELPKEVRTWRKKNE